MKCNHKYVDMEDGTRDKFCVRCGKRAKQGVMYIKPKIEIQIGDVNKNVIDRIAKEIERGIALNKG